MSYQKLKESPFGGSGFSGISEAKSPHNLLETNKVAKTNDIIFNKDNDWIISIGGAFGKKSYVGDIGVISGAAVEGMGTMGFRIGSEFSLNDNFFIAPKVGAEFNFFFISAKMSLINYTDFKHYEPKITPEIGLSIVGFLNFTYGYNIPLSQRRMENVPTYRFSVILNIPLSTHPAP
jgi:hypothetical protein